MKQKDCDNEKEQVGLQVHLYCPRDSGGLLSETNTEGRKYCGQGQFSFCASKSRWKLCGFPRGVYKHPLDPLAGTRSWKYMAGLTAGQVLLVFAQMTTLVPGGFCRHAQV